MNLPDAYQIGFLGRKLFVLALELIKRRRELKKVWKTGKVPGMGVEDYVLFESIIISYQLSQFVSTIVLSDALLECWLSSHAYNCGLIRKNDGLGAVLKVAETNSLVFSDLNIERLKHLRSVRNNFIHYREIDDPYRIFSRCGNYSTFDTMWEDDAKIALDCIFTVMNNIEIAPRRKQID